MPWLNRGDSRLYYELHAADTVDAAQPAVVLLHGVGGNHASWFHQTSAWRRHRRVLTPDARGFGNSTDAEGLGRDAFADDVIALLDDAGIERAVVIGQSMGGGTAVELACTQPRRVAGVVLADTLFGLTLPPPLDAELAAVTRRCAALTQQERVLGPSFRSAQPALSTLYTALASFNHYHVRNLAGTQRSFDLQELAASGVPLLWLVGDEDVLFPPALVRGAHARLPGSQLVVLPAVGHSAYFEAPAAFNDQVDAWIRACVQH